jgi:hypothetical protein
MGKNYSFLKMFFWPTELAAVVKSLSANAAICNGFEHCETHKENKWRKVNRITN